MIFLVVWDFWDRRGWVWEVGGFIKEEEDLGKIDGF
jgi:hypothetical protein